MHLAAKKIKSITTFFAYIPRKEIEYIWILIAITTKDCTSKVLKMKLFVKISNLIRITYNTIVKKEKKGGKTKTFLL